MSTTDRLSTALRASEAVSQDVVLEHLDRYREHWRSSRSGTPQRRLPALPDPGRDDPGLANVAAQPLRMALRLAGRLAKWVSCYRVLRWSARLRLVLDDLALEPRGCALASACTDFGLAYLANGHVEEALRCLDRSWRGYPCPHTVAFGLPTDLYHALRREGGQDEVREVFAEMAAAFGRGA